MNRAIVESLHSVEALLKRRGEQWGAQDLDALEMACSRLIRAVAGARDRAVGLRPLWTTADAMQTQLGRDLRSADQWSAHFIKLHKALFLDAAGVLAANGRKEPAARMFSFLLENLPGDKMILGRLKQERVHIPEAAATLEGDYAFSLVKSVSFPEIGFIWSLSAVRGEATVLAADMKRNSFHIFDFDGTWRREIALDVDSLSAVTFCDGIYWACDWGGSRILGLNGAGEVRHVLDCGGVLPEGFPRGPERICVMGQRMFVQFTRRANDKLDGGALESGLVSLEFDGSACSLKQCSSVNRYFLGGVAAHGESLLALHILSPACLYEISPEDIQDRKIIHADSGGCYNVFDVIDDDIYIMADGRLVKRKFSGNEVYSVGIDEYGAGNISSLSVADSGSKRKIFAYQYPTHKIFIFDV